MVFSFSQNAIWLNRQNEKNMVSKFIKRCSILSEFTGKEQDQYFGLKTDKTLHHIDTLYYSVAINEPEEVVKLQSEDKLPENLTNFLNKLRDMKAYVRGNEGKFVEIAGMEAVAKAFSIYEFCVSLNECFDIFIASYLPNEETPRIVVQLRSRYLVLEGVRNAVERSFAFLKNLLEPFELFPVTVRENRIDYAFHTNLIQNPYKYFRDENLKKCLKTNLRKYQKIGNIGEDISVDTFNLGNRKSNNVYFRAYNKCREVIEMNYKSFFIERWYQNGLISAFDKYVYEVAYELKSYRTGCLVGRLKWYLEFGSSDDLKEECQKLLDSDFVRSDNCSHIEKKIKGVIPEPTLILNIEYQTKRKFYQTCSSFLDLFENDEDLLIYEQVPLSQLVDEAREENLESIWKGSGYDPLLRDLYVILGNASAFIDYLTSYGNCVSFVKDRTMSLKAFLEEGQPYLNWWKRVRGTPIDYSADPILEVYRKYDLNANIRKSRRLVAGNVARLAMLRKNSTRSQTFVEDFSDFLCVVNDNDLPPALIIDVESGAVLEPDDYSEIRQRISRRMRGIIRDDPITEN